MSSLRVPNQTVAAMSPAEAEAFVRDLDRQRRVVEAQIATFVHQVAETGMFAIDKHRTPKAWGKAACNWSGTEAARFVKAGAMLATFDSAAALAAEGGLGVAQMHALAEVTANRRVQEHLAAGEEQLVGQASVLDYDDYVLWLANWERVADADGAHADTERTHRNRKASASIVGDQFFLDATSGTAQGVQIKEILEAFAKTEWAADWEAGLLTHGDAMCPHLMERTDGQRRMDALLAIFLKAAGAEAEPTGSGFTVNIIVSQPVLEHHLLTLLSNNPVPPLDPNLPGHRCETTTGVPVDPYDMLVAAAMGHVRRVVMDSTGVVTDMGRKQRLFTGALRDAVLMHSRRCVWPGCHRPANQCDADHVLPWANAGPTNTRNGGPVCSHHNRWKATGYRTWRDPQGHWHHYRPDGTEIGWRNGIITQADHVFAMPAAS
ncbi:MAG: HNH endonuclease [Ilumatobacteraceae bacterium]|nr:HNH endonuclease [Ilumatobacteraceae bacterium]